MYVGEELLQIARSKRMAPAGAAVLLYGYLHKMASQQNTQSKLRKNLRNKINMVRKDWCSQQNERLGGSCTTTSVLAQAVGFGCCWWQYWVPLTMGAWQTMPWWR